MFTLKRLWCFDCRGGDNRLEENTMSQPPAKNGKSAAADAGQPASAMHASQCSICRHPEWEEIEREFMMWKSAKEIANDFQLPSHTSVYRHAHAAGLFDQRRGKTIFALDRVIEHACDVKPTAAAVVSAIALIVKINARGGRS